MPTTTIPYNDPTLLIVISLFIFWIGCCIGSFLNVCVWRIPRNESLSVPSSHCPSCNYAIPLWLNIPLVSWLFLRGKCYNCKATITVRYFVVELMTGLLFLTAWFLLMDSLYRFELLPGWLTLTALLICCGVIDFEKRIIPNKVTYFGIGVGLILSMVYPALQGGADYDNFLKLQGTVFLPLLQKQFSFVDQNFNGSWMWGGVSAILGILVGYLVIALFIEVGKVLFGRYSVKVKEPVKISIEKSVVTIGEESYNLETVFSRKSDQIKVWLDNDDGVLVISETSVTIDGQDASELTVKNARTTHWSIPCEVMGYGDAKMLAMCGAFLGPESIFMILSLSSILATALFLPYSLIKRNFHFEIPFGVFIAIAAYLVCLFA